MDVFTKEKRSEVMRSIRSRDTGPELAIRRVLFSRGYRYRLHVAGLPGKPDIVLPRYRTVIEVRGCFWHGHSCYDGHIPRSRQEYWAPKIASNMARDCKQEQQLHDQGWNLLVVWACECTPTKIQETADRVVRALKEAELSL